MNQNAVGQLRLSSETLGKLTSECTLVTPEVKPTKPVRGSVLITKGKAESHGSGSQKQHHQHSSETPQVQIRAPQKEGWEPPLLLPPNPLPSPTPPPPGILHLGQHNLIPTGALAGQTWVLPLYHS